MKNKKVRNIIPVLVVAIIAIALSGAISVCAISELTAVNDEKTSAEKTTVKSMTLETVKDENCDALLLTGVNNTRAVTLETSGKTSDEENTGISGLESGTSDSEKTHSDTGEALAYVSGISGGATDDEQESSEDNIEIDPTETDASALGFDTSEAPEGYDADSDENPGGSEYVCLEEVSEIASVHNNEIKLVGHDNDPDDNYTSFLNASKTINGLNISNNLCARDGVSADFNGKGKNSFLAVAELEITKDEYKYRQYCDLSLKIRDTESEKESDKIVVQTDIINSDPDTGHGSQIKQALVQITTGDYDGDEKDEIALFVPGKFTDTIHRIAIFDMRSDSLAPTDSTNWKEVWSYTLPQEKYGWNCVDLASGDASHDKVDDLIVSWGRVSNYWYDYASDNVIDENFAPSKSVMLLGDKRGNMLRDAQKIEYDSEKICRTAFVIEDINSDGLDEVIFGGELYDDICNKNLNTRCLGFCHYDTDSKKLELEKFKNLKIVDGEYSSGTWKPENGYDDKYYSMPYLKANIAATQIYGKTNGSYIYMDSVLYKYNGDFEIIDELDDSNKPFENYGKYLEFGAKGGYFAGTMSQGLSVQTVQLDSKNNNASYKSSFVYAKDTSDAKQGGELIKTEIRSQRLNGRSYIIGLATYSGSFSTLVNSDIDSTISKYTGEHYFEYSNPKVFAVLTSAPYFEDVAENSENGEDVKAFSSTGWGKSTGTSNSKGTVLSVSAQGHVEYEEGFPLCILAHSGDLGYAHTKNEETTISKEFTVSYSTVAGEDCVVFYSMPTAVYKYSIKYMQKNENGKYEQKEKEQLIRIPYQPVTQTISMETYNDIQKMHSSLPVIEGNIIKSEAGDPSSYPSSIKGLTNAVEYDGDWSSPSFSEGGDVTQEITQSREETKSYTHELAYNTATSFGSEAFKAGVTLSVNAGSSGGDATSESTTARGTVYNMGKDVKRYGYYFAWKLITYDYEMQDGTIFPVVSYITKNVTKPPALPSDFSQDYSKTTEKSMALKWTGNDNSVSYYDIYRYLDFAEGAGDVKVGTVKASEYKIRKNNDGTIKYDDKGNVIKEYSFVEDNLAEYSDYEYSIQAVGEKVPPESILSKKIKTRTKALFTPKIDLSDDELTVYFDTVKTVTVDAKESDSFIYRNKNFQWQKFDEDDNTWNDLEDEQEASLKFRNCTMNSSGKYRCRVNTEISVLGAVYRVTAYSEVLTVKYDKRNVSFGEITYEEKDGKTEFTQTVTNSGDGTKSQPTGKVRFILSSEISSKSITADIDTKTGTASACFDNLSSGIYKVNTTYVGNNALFRDADNPEELKYLKDVEDGNWLSGKDSYEYNEDLMETLKLYSVKKSKSGGVAEKDITESITRIDLVYSNDNIVYKTIDINQTNPVAVIPAIYDRNNYTGEGYVMPDLIVKVYVGSNLFASKRIKIKTEKINLSLDDITFDKEEDFSIGIKDIVVNGDKTKTYPTVSDESIDRYLNIGIYTSTGDFIGYAINSIYGEYDKKYINPKDLSPGKYRIKAMCEYKVYKFFYDFDCSESSMIVLGNSYGITAEGITENSKNIGNVKLISPDEKSNVVNERYQGGTTLVFKAVPSSGYTVKYWVVNDHGTDRIIDSTSDILTYKVQGTNSQIYIKAAFMMKENRLSYETIGGGEGSEVTCESDNLSNESLIPTGKKLTFKAKAAAGYEFVEWRYVGTNGKSIVKKGVVSEDNSESTVTVTMGDSSAVLFAVFQREKISLSLSNNLKAYYINTSEIDATIADGTEMAVNNEMKVAKGAEIIIRPEDGYRVEGEWTVSGIDKDKIKSIESGTAIKFNVPDNADSVTVTASAAPGLYSLNLQNEDDEGLITAKIDGKKVSGSQLSEVTGGSVVELTALPKRGTVFEGWKINNKIVDQVTSNIYTVKMTRNMTVSAVYKDIEEFEIKALYKGQGSVDYKIITPYGQTETRSISSKETSITVFKGETITFTSKPADSYMASYVVLDGKRIENTKLTYTISDIHDNHNLTIGMDPAVYHEVSVENENGYVLYTLEGVKINNSFYVGNKEDYTIVLKGTEGKAPYVYLDGRAVSVTKQDDGSYVCVINGVTENADLKITDRSIFFIKTADDFIAYKKALKKADGELNGELENDIINVSLFDNEYYADLNANFDGNGHSISGINTCDSEAMMNYIFCPLFGNIGERGVVRNLNFKDITVDTSQKGDSGLIAFTNKGTITDCTVSKVKMIFKNNSKAGVIAGSNAGTIKECLVQDVTVQTSNKGGIVYSNKQLNNSVKPKISNCYVKNLRRSDDEYGEAIAVENDGTIDYCYYDNGKDYITESKLGTSAWKDNEKISGFKFCYDLNKNENSSWGVAADDSDETPVPIRSGYIGFEKKPEKPLKVVFNGYKEIFMVSGKMDIPDRKNTGIDAWVCKGICYAEGSKNIEVKEDMMFSPVETAEYVYNCRTDYDGGAQYFLNITDAVKFADENNGNVKVINDISVDKSITINVGRTVSVLKNAVLTIEDGQSIENNGRLVIESKGKIQNYGFFQNNKGGVLEIKTADSDKGVFVNYGAFKNSGEIINKNLILCKNHSWGSAEITKQPTTEEAGEKVLTCEVCGAQITKTIPKKGAGSDEDKDEKNPEIEMMCDEVILAQKSGTFISVDTENCSSDGEIIWTSSDESIATVKPVDGKRMSEDAIVYCNKVGTAKIKATYKDAKHQVSSEELTVTVMAQEFVLLCNGVNVEELLNNEGELTLLMNGEDSYDFSCTNIDNDIMWSSKDEDVFTVDSETGTVTPVAVGRATLIGRTQLGFDISIAISIVDHICKFDGGTETVIKPATCTENGIRTINCTVDGCDKSKTEEIKATGHKFVHIVKAAKVGVAGKEYDACTVCDYRKNIKTIKALKPEATTIVKMAAVNKGFIIKWNKKTCDGYNIQYSRYSNFAKAKKNIVVKNSRTVTKIITKLAKKKKYYVRIRTYAKVGGKHYLSGWSKVRAIRPR